MIILYERLGFQLCVAIMCVFLLIPLLLLIRFQEPQLDSRPQKQNLKILLKVFKRKGMITWLVLMVFFTGSTLMASTMFRPMLVDKGINLETLGLLFGIVTPIIGVIGNLVAPFVINKLGRKNTLVIFGFVICLQLVGYIFIALDLVGLKTIFAIHGVWGFTGGFSTIVIYSIMMDKSEQTTAATDLTVQLSVLAAGSMGISAVSGFIATAIGYTGTFLLSTGLTVMTVIFIALFLESRSLEKATVSREQ
jgi:MFS transporter, PAT family, beta-lactamase induction signal transducer AmpG